MAVRLADVASREAFQQELARGVQIDHPVDSPPA
jgi:hypothetical protein